MYFVVLCTYSLLLLQLPCAWFLKTGVSGTDTANSKIAVVTGGNKGIGYAIVKGLCEKYDGKVYLTARDINRGQSAVEKLKKLGFSPLFHQLDVTDQESIDKFKDYIIKEHGGIDILVNNAAISLSRSAEPYSVQANKTIAVNYFGLLKVCKTLSPILKKNARVVNLSSLLGHLYRIPSATIRAKFSDPSLTEDGLNNLMEEFVHDAKRNNNSKETWSTPYEVSKVGVTALTFLQQKDFDKEQPNRNISVNAVHPGYVDTDLTHHKGRLTIEEGAKAPLYLALDNHNLKGKYVWFDCQVVDWYGKDTPK